MWLTCSVLGGVWLMQVVVMMLLHHGNTAPRRWWPCYLAATALGIATSAACMWLFMLMNANLGLGLATGGSYILSQAGLLIVTRARPSPAQIAGTIVTTAGLFVLAMGTPS